MSPRRSRAPRSKSSSPKTGPRDRGGAGAKKTDSGAAKSSRDYKAKDLKATGKEDWKKERSKHTAAAEKTARKDVKAATGKDAKIAGQKLPGAKVEHHHHAGVKRSKQVGLNPKVAGKKERMTTVH